MFNLGWFKPKKDAAQKELERIRKKELRETYETERHKANLREIKKKAKLDAQHKNVPLSKRLGQLNTDIGSFNDLLMGPQKKKKRDSNSLIL